MTFTMTPGKEKNHPVPPRRGVLVAPRAPDHAVLAWAMASWIVALCAAAPLRAGTNFWTSLGPNGGAVTAVLPDLAATGVAYAGTSGGIFKTSDAGATWQPASRGLTDYAITGLAADPHRPGTLYATAYGGLAVSHDAAATWTPIAFPTVRGIPLGNLLSVAVDPALPDTVYVGTNFSIWVSHDGGIHWSASTAFRHRQITVVADPARSSVFALFPDFDLQKLRLFESADGGATWIDRSATLPPGFGDGLGTTVLAVAPAPSGTLWLAAQDGASGQTFRSADGGASWQAEPGGYPVAAGAGGLVVAGRLRSLDGGDTWQAAGLPPGAATALAISADAGRIYAASATVGMSVSADAALTWQVANQGLTASVLAAVAINPRRPAILYAALGNSGLVKSTNGGGVWRPIGPALAIDQYGEAALVLAPAAPSTLYLVDAPGSLLNRSTDAGASWAVLPAPAGECLNVATLTPDPTSAAILYATGALGAGADCENLQPQCSAFKSIDAGATWTCMESPAALRLFVAPSLPSTLYGLGSFGPGRSLLWKSVDSGAQWSPIGAGVPLTALAPFPTQMLAVDPTDALRLFVSTTDGAVWRSLDGGAHWQEADRGLPRGIASPVLLAIDRQNPELVYAARFDIGVYRSTNGGRTWQPILAGLPPLDQSPLFPTHYAALVPDPQRSGTVYLAAWGRGLMVYSSQ